MQMVALSEIFERRGRDEIWSTDMAKTPVFYFFSVTFRAWSPRDIEPDAVIGRRCALPECAGIGEAHRRDAQNSFCDLTIERKPAGSRKNF
jgi:hypothetical protein